MSERTLNFRKSLEGGTVLESLSKIDANDIDKLYHYLNDINREINTREHNDVAYISSIMTLNSMDINVETTNGGTFEGKAEEGIVTPMFRVNIQSHKMDSLNNLNIMGTGEYGACTQAEYDEFINMIGSLLKI